MKGKSSKYTEITEVIASLSDITNVGVISEKTKADPTPSLPHKGFTSTSKQNNADSYIIKQWVKVYMIECKP